MQIRRLTAATAVALALVGVAGCRTSPNVAAYVGDEQVTVSELESAVDARLDDQAIADFAAADPDAFTRGVLTDLVQDEIHDIAARRYGVEVGDGEVRSRIDALLAGQDPAQVYAQLAGQGVSREKVFSTIRQQLIRLEIAEQEGLATGLSEEQLRAGYQEVREQSAQYQLGYITVPDQQTAASAVAQLATDPGSYAELAERYAGDFTLATPELRSRDQLPGPIAEEVAAAEPGTAFAVPVEETGGIVIGFVADVQYPTFQEVRPQLEQQALAGVEQQVAPLVEEVRESIDVTVNPRYGQLEDGNIAPGDGGVVDLLDGGS